MKTILLVDDEPDLIKVIKIRLETNNYKVLTASDGRECLEKIKIQIPDMIIMDFMMPNMDGIKACALIKSDRRYQKIPVIILTASADETSRSTSKQVGANEFCNKPLNMDELLKKIVNLI